MTSLRLDLIASSWARIPLRTLTLPPATHTNAMLIGGSRIILVDPGSNDPTEQGSLFEVLTARLAGGARLSGVLLTHHHQDHTSGLAALLTALEGAGHAAPPVMVHPLDRASCPIPAGVEVIELEDEQILDLGSTKITVLHTPGHTRGHVALFDAVERLLHAGDMVASVGTIMVAPPDGDMTDYMRSLERLRALDARLMVPSHGDPIGDPEDHLSDYIAHRGMREGLVQAALTDTPRSPITLVPAAYPELSVVFYPLAVQSLTAHLIKLAREGKAVEDEDGGWQLP